MARINDNYLKLESGYLFPEVSRRVDAFQAANPQAASRLLHCGIGDVTEPLPPAAVEAMHRAIQELGRRETFRGYGPYSGYDFLREAVVAGDFHDRGIDVDASEVFVSDGSKGDCGSILEILGPGNRVAVADPVYPVYVDTNVMAGNSGPSRGGGAYEGIVYLPSTPRNGFVPDPPDPPADLVYLCFPNNPTGAMIRREQLRAWVDHALRHDAIILYDAAYSAFVREPGLPRSIYEIEGARRCAVEFHSFSKDGGFTGVRCGYTVVPRDLEGTARDGRRVRLHDLWTRRFATRTNGVSYVVQRAAEALYGPEGRRQVRRLTDHYMEAARILRQGCQAAGLTAWGGVNAPYVWVACPTGMGSWETFDLLLREAGIVVTPGVGFGRCGEGFFRMSAFGGPANASEAAGRLARLGPAPRRIAQPAGRKP
jgi:LL-diaminopimelate aminotransferase